MVLCYSSSRNLTHGGIVCVVFPACLCSGKTSSLPTYCKSCHVEQYNSNPDWTSLQTCISTHGASLQWLKRKNMKLGNCQQLFSTTKRRPVCHKTKLAPRKAEARLRELAAFQSWLSWCLRLQLHRDLAVT